MRQRNKLISSVVGLTAAVMLAVTACSAGQITQTSDQRSTVGGADVISGHIKIVNAFIESPGEAGKHESGDELKLQMTIVNTGQEADELESIEVDGQKVELTQESGSSSGSSAASSSAETSGAETSGAGSSATTLELAPQGKITIGGDAADASATFSHSGDELYASQLVPVTVTMKNGGTIEFEVPVATSDDPIDRDPSSSFNLHGH